MAVQRPMNIWKRRRTTRNRSQGTLIKYWWTLGVAPKPALLKQSRDGVLALRALCPNDAVARAIAKVLPRLPHLYKVDIADNRLGDVALKEIVDAVNTTSTITSLDLSRNKIDDEASEAIMALIGNDEHGLKELVMSMRMSTTASARHLSLRLSITKGYRRWICRTTC